MFELQRLAGLEEVVQSLGGGASLEEEGHQDWALGFHSSPASPLPTS